jgi:phosphonate transport system substrate-binding protein
LKKVGLLPDSNYKFGFSSSHDLSIEGVAKGEIQAAPVAGDLLQRAEAEGGISTDKYRAIYTSQRFPPLAVGFVYNLSPELAEKIRAALIDFPWKGSGLEKQFAGTGAAKFVPINYKDDFAVIREIDGALVGSLAENSMEKKK